MSLYSRNWKIDGVQAAFIMRGVRNGSYLVLFEREFAELPQIEAINWAKPTIEHTNPRSSNELGLPEGYGFEVERITYDSTARSYTVEVRVATQYLGDVTEYQDQISQLESAAAEKDNTISAQASQLQEKEATITEQAAAIQEKEATITEQTAALQEKEATITEQAATIQDQAATIEELESSGGGAVITQQLEAAYQEGVESNG